MIDVRKRLGGLGGALVCFSALAVGCTSGASPLPTTPDGSAPTGWTVIPAGTANLNAISGVSDSALWIVGDRGTIYHWNGTKLLLETSGTTATLRGVTALDTDQAYAVGDAGTILHRLNGVWHQEAAKLTRQVLTGVWADTNNVYAVGSAGTVVYGTAGTYKIVPSTYAENVFAITGKSGQLPAAVGALGLLMQVGPGSTGRVPIAAFSKLLTGAAMGSAAAYYVGQQGTVYQADTTGLAGLTSIPGCPATALRAVSVVDTTAWIVGWDGTICKVSGTHVTSYPYTDGRWFNGVYAASPTSIWVVGASGTLLHGLPANPDGGVADGSTAG